MARPIVAVSAVVVGCLAFVAAARFTVHSSAAEHAAGAPHAAGSEAARAPALAQPAIIRLPPQLIRASLPHRRRVAEPARRRRVKPPAKGWPCSPWRALGPVYAVHEGEKPRQRHVRSLCFGPRPRGQLAGPR
jgi:hypothetical protein